MLVRVLVVVSLILLLLLLVIAFAMVITVTVSSMRSFDEAPITIANRSLEAPAEVLGEGG